ncbi:MAG TPA: glutamate formimidoyltransferase [Candidatus Cloacimonadota bacterium]|nr:glutamate formimidoyltransferase [Candidatus Cloacimonadota bacterium]HQL14712.1 glutamate formimidoyltransferase [Candidatus Cloacimonadota bacterium]
MKLMECVPNFSEGRDKKVLDAIADEIRSVRNVTLLDIDPGADTNRTVFTFAGEPEAVVEAAFLAIKKAAELIDMSKHHGAHPRMGATDVCPFIPISEMSMDECVQWAKVLGERVGRELNIPVYLYEYAATKPEWQNLANIRQGEYEALPEKAKDPYWKPDFGPHEFNPKSGATAIGAREFLIAYNINLNTRDKRKAHELALMIRESGRPAKGPDGKQLKDAEGNKIIIPGLFQYCKAVGWYIESYRRAQISINLTNYKVTPPHLVLEKVRSLAADIGIQVTGSELVGLIPKDALLEAGKFYLRRMNESAGLPEKMILETAVQSMGLTDLGPFDLNKKVIEYAIARQDALVKLSLNDFCDLLSTDEPAPGGGSVAALCTAMSAALTSMVSNLTFDKKGYENVQEEVLSLAEQGQSIKEKALQIIDQDTDAFNQMMEALRLPKKTEEEIALRNAKVEETTQKAILVPMETLKLSLEAMKLAQRISQIGNLNAVSDAGVAALTALSGAKGAYYNILINSKSLSTESFKRDILSSAQALLQETENLAQTVEQELFKRLG